MSQLVEISRAVDVLKSKLQTMFGDDCDIIVEYQIVPRNTKKTYMDTSYIIDAVCYTGRITRNEIISRSRERRVTYPRHVAIALIKKIRPDITLKEIGNLFGNRVHSTILASINFVDDMDFNKPLKELYMSCVCRLNLLS